MSKATMVEEKEKKKLLPEKKKNGKRARIKLDVIFESTPKPKTPKPKTPKQVKLKRVIPQEKKANDISVLHDVTSTTNQLPIEAGFPKDSLVSKRILDFDLNCQLEEFRVEDDEARTLISDNNKSMQVTKSPSLVMHLPRHALQLRCECCSCLFEKMKPLCPKECRKKRTPSRISTARKKRLLPSRSIVNDDFKCVMALTRTFVVSTTKKRKRRAKHMKQCHKNAMCIDNGSSQKINLNDFPAEVDMDASLATSLKTGNASLLTSDEHPHHYSMQIAPYGMDHSATRENEKVTKGKKKSYTYKNKKGKDIWVNTSLEEMMKFITNKFEELHVTPNALVLYKYKKIPMEVDLDEDTLRIWNILKSTEDFTDPVKESDEAKEKWWEEQRNILSEKAALFTIQMREFLGDRRFSPWKGSIVDSIVGVFLTQNVSDNLSSSAFMSVVARYPAKLPNEDANHCTELKLVSNHEQSVVRDEECCEAFEGTSVNTTRMSNKISQKKTEKNGKNIEEVNWDTLRTTYSKSSHGNNKCPNTLDSVDWDAVRKASVEELAYTIKGRGQHNILAQKVKDFLDRIVNDHGSTDLEWLRDVPPDKIKEYLLDIDGLGLKSVECLRLLTLRHDAFPVDTNVGRIAVRLGWVPLMPLPESVPFHLLEKYPEMDKIQAYLWPRLLHLNENTKYELHYLLITFGKVFCTKRKPNCNACPLRGDCKYYASARASSILTLPGTKPKSNKKALKKIRNPFDLKPSPLALLPMDSITSGPRLEVVNCEPIIEEPASPERERLSLIEREIEDFLPEDPNEMLFLDLTSQWSDVQKYKEMSKALVTLSPGVAPKPTPQKLIARLRTEHHVYELPDSHPLLKGMEKRETYDPSPYLLAIWSKDDITHNCQPEKSNDNACSSSRNSDEEENLTVQGTLLIPCRTAMRGNFPLNGTYFQVNEVFADDESSRNPIDVPRSLIWNLRKRTLYCGYNVISLIKELSEDQVKECFWTGFICVRGFSRQTRMPKDLPPRFHVRLKGTPKVKKQEKIDGDKKIQKPDSSS